jgi:hypothetical protein
MSENPLRQSGFPIQTGYMPNLEPPVALYYWEPREDITLYELAVCLPLLQGGTGRTIERLAPQFKRHFR